MDNVCLLRSSMARQGFIVAGTPSPIVPVFVGDEPLARLTSRYLAANGLLANLVEFPAVAKGKARFRFQVMSNHPEKAITRAPAVLAAAKAKAAEELGHASCCA
jgi:7-keto-8-aminopelargonate synthetase-like enzyme